MEFSIENQWEDRFIASVKIKNTGKEPIESWRLAFYMPYKIDNIWNGVLESEEGRYVVKNAGWNEDIPAGESTVFGFQAEKAGAIQFPEKYELLQGGEEADEEEYTVECKIKSDWKTGYEGELRIVNNADRALEDWKLEFDFKGQIDRFWDARIECHKGAYIVSKETELTLSGTAVNTLDLEEDTGRKRQRFELEGKENSIFLIRCKENGKCLEAVEQKDGSFQPFLMPKTGEKGQQWELELHPDGYCTIKSVLAGKYLNGGRKNSPKVALTGGENPSEEKWDVDYRESDIIRQTGFEKDADGDGLYDVWETKGMRIANGQTVTSDPKKADTDGDGLDDREEMGEYLEINMPVGQGKWKKEYVYKEKSSPKLKDTDKDGIVDIMDPYPTKSCRNWSYGKYFQLVNSLEYGPASDDVRNNQMKEQKQKDPSEIGKRKCKSIKWRAKAMKTAAALVPTARKMLAHYLDASGTPLSYNNTGILLNGRAKKAYEKNMDHFFHACEYMVKDGTTRYVATTDNACNGGPGFMKLDFSGEKRIWEYFDGSMLEGFLGVDHANLALVGECTRRGNRYSMTFYLYILDYYDFIPGDSRRIGLVSIGEMAFLHQYKFARNYRSTGRSKWSIEWNRGMRYKKSGNKLKGSYDKLYEANIRY